MMFQDTIFKIFGSSKEFSEVETQARFFAEKYPKFEFYIESEDSNKIFAIIPKETSVLTVRMMLKIRLEERAYQCRLSNNSIFAESGEQNLEVQILPITNLNAYKIREEKIRISL